MEHTAAHWAPILNLLLVTTNTLFVRTQVRTVVEDMNNTHVMKGDMKLVNTADIEGPVSALKYARTVKGTIDLNAYIGLDAKIITNKLEVNVKIINARRRFGHLDLLVIPTSGTGEVWVERKNIQIINDPALSPKVSTHNSDVVEPEMTLEMVKQFLKSQNLSLSKE